MPSRAASCDIKQLRPVRRGPVRSLRLLYFLGIGSQPLDHSAFAPDLEVDSEPADPWHGAETAAMYRGLGHLTTRRSARAGLRRGADMGTRAVGRCDCRSRWSFAGRGDWMTRSNVALVRHTWTARCAPFNRRARSACCTSDGAAAGRAIRPKAFLGSAGDERGRWRSRTMGPALLHHGHG